MTGNSFTSRHLAACAVACSTILTFNMFASAGNYPTLEPIINQGLTTSPPGFPGLYWNLSGGLTAPLIDEAGKITFGGRIFGTGVTTLNNRLFWRGDAGGWTVLARSSETLPGLPAGVTLLQPSESGFFVSGNGKVMISSTLQGTGVVTTNDTAFWYGQPASLTLGSREGDVITPGGALINSAMTLSTRVNNAGQVLVPTNLTGGDAVTANNSGIFLYGPGGYTKVWRKGDPIPGAPALPATDGPFMTPSLFTLSMNSSGAVAFTGTLVAGTAGGVATTDDAVMAVTDGAGVTRIIAREDSLYLPLCSDTDPKTPGYEISVRYRRTSSFTPATRSINNGSKVLFNAMIEGVTGAHGVSTANDSLWLLDTGSGDPQIVLREGQPITGLNFNLANFQAIMLNNNDRMAFAGTALDGAMLSSSCIWTGPAGGPYTLIAKTGDPLPGSTDAFLNPNIAGANLTFNNADQVIFTCDLTGPGVTAGVNDRTIMGWDPVQGLIVIARTGVTTLPELLNLSLLNLPGTTYQTGDGGCAYFTDNGWLTFKVQDLKGYQAIVRCRPFDVNDCSADINGDSEVNVTDLLAVIAAWGACADPNNCPADTNNDDQVNVTDLLAVIAAWGSCL